MSMRNFVEGECGGPNSLVKVALHFTQDRALQQERLHRGQLTEADLSQVTADTHRQDDKLVSEFLSSQYARKQLAEPHTFCMENLLAEMHGIEKVQQINSAQDIERRDIETGEKWAEEYLSSALEASNVRDQGWCSEFMKDSSNIPDVVSDTKWAAEYLDEAQHSGELRRTWFADTETGDELRNAAADFVANMKDPKIKGTKFMSFIEQLSNGESSSQQAEKWVEEFEFGTDKDLEENWLSEFESSRGAGGEFDEVDYIDRLQEQWDEISREDGDGSHPWLTSYDSVSDSYAKYEANKNNPFADHPDPFQEGLKCLKEGDVPSAVLLFEAAVQKDAENADAWRYLGTSQAENENDPLAIAALRRCLELDAANLTALLALSVSYTNESMQIQACHCLHQWLKNNPKYSHLAAENLSSKLNPTVASLMDKPLHDEMCNMFMAAARLSPADVDPDVQCALGVLFHLSADFDKAVDCFRAAVQAKPNDWQLWNKLGATLANGKRPEEAVEAYSKALQLYPGFIRSRFNLGISCLSMKAYREAAEHFLTALNMQAAGRGLVGSSTSSTMSESIWSSLHLTLSFLERQDLYSAVHERNLAVLNAEFGLTTS